MPGSDFFPLSGTMSEPFQKPKTACCLNAAMLQSIPWYMKCGKLHFIVSSTSGHAAWIVSRSPVRIGFAKSAAFAMYASTRRSLLPMHPHADGFVRHPSPTIMTANMSLQQDPSPTGAPLRVEGLMRDIEEALRRDRRRRLLGRGAPAVYDDDELFAAAESLLRRTVGDRAEGSLLLPDLLEDPEDWLLNTRPPAITSHRPVIGPLIVWLKRRIAMPATRWLYDYVADNVRRQD